MTKSKLAAILLAAQLLLIAAASKEAAAQVAATQAATQAADATPAAAFKPLAPPTFASREQQMVIAAYNGDAATVKKLLADGVNVNTRFEITASNFTNVWAGEPVRLPVATVGQAWPDLIEHTGNTALHEALSRDRFELAAYLLDHGADINAKDAADFAPIHQAVMDPKKLDFLIARGADVNAKDTNGESALYLAVLLNDMEGVKKLLKAKADVNARDDRGEVPLHVVRDAQTAKLLLAAGARVDLTDWRGFTPLMNFEWSVERIELDKAARLNGPPRPRGRFEGSTYTRPGPRPEYEELERQGLKGEALAQRLNDQRSTEIKAVADVLKAAGAK
ncbi:MAG TPA: ankyrin repeat domain-containing protein [Humisphaera sp.]|jgi:ankyrin repeat protein|nr:ankyrin repeat domain-containing protein [Humisphaera sp.]